MGIKDKIPFGLLNILKGFRNRFEMKRKYMKDISHLKLKNRTKDSQREKLEGIITKEYHRIEKGLSKTNFRIGFGERALYNLELSLKLYLKSGFSKENIRFRTGVSAIQAYVNKHDKLNYDTQKLKSFLASLGIVEKMELSGVNKYNKSDIITYCNSNFEMLSMNRHSVRTFSKEIVNIDKINKSLKIAMKTPSVCNRQGWRARVIRDKEILTEFKSVHNGFSDKDQDLSTLILITSLNNYFSYPLERNQGYIDGGLFSMSLIYALTSQGLATCALNANLTMQNERKLRQLLNVGISENFIMFIAVGNYPDVFISPKSIRDSYEEKTLYY